MSARKLVALGIAIVPLVILLFCLLQLRGGREKPGPDFSDLGTALIRAVGMGAGGR